MSTSNPSERLRVIGELDTVGYSLTSFEDLGLPFNEAMASRLTTTTTDSEFSPAAADITKHIDKKNMVMVQDYTPLVMGRLMVAPVVETFFSNNERALRNWNLYALNRYESKGSLGAHQDGVGSTVFVATFSGERQFNIHRIIDWGKEVYGEIIDSFTLGPGTIMALDGEIDPAHSAACLQSPSVSAVFDIPDLLRI